MSKKHGKDLDEKQYCSQPVNKSSSWVPPKWRRLSLRSKNQASSSFIQDDGCSPGVQDDVPSSFVQDSYCSTTLKDDVQEEPEQLIPVEHHSERVEIDQQKTTKFIFLSEQSPKWSINVHEFYENGDADFCYSKLLDIQKLDGDFWGTLLGYRSEGHLWPMHIEGWVRRMMLVRGKDYRRHGPAGLDWTIMPPQFRQQLFFGDNNGAEYANGTNKLYPPFWEVRYVYIPLFVEKVNEWLLVKIDLYSMEMTQYWTNRRFESEYTTLVHHSILDPFHWQFEYLLVEINYWSQYKGPYISKSKRLLNLHNASGEYMPEDGTVVGGDSGVFVCFLMTKLVSNKPVIKEENFKDICSRFRCIMANQFYKSRYVPEIPDEVKWSPSAVEFYLSGEAPYCHCLYFDQPLTRKFWGCLLGFEKKTNLWPLHISGWVKRMLRMRIRKLGEKGPTGLNWTVLPPSFRQELFVSTYEKPVHYANGKNELYPKFWEVQYVFIPFEIKEIHEWILVRIDLETMEMVQYWSNNIYHERYELIDTNFAGLFDHFFESLLHQIGYHRRANTKAGYDANYRFSINQVICKTYLPKEGGLGSDSGVLVCMLIHKLTKGKTITIGEDFKEVLENYRQYMANDFYKHRCEA